MRGPLTIVSCGPASFAGAGTAHVRTLVALVERGVECIWVGFDPPFLASELDRGGVRHISPSVRCDAYPKSEAIAMSAIAESIRGEALAAAARGRRVVLVATYLPRFAQAVHLAHQSLPSEPYTPFIVVPAGSDVWQVGVQVPSVLRLLTNAADACVTYSAPFAAEVEALLGPVQRSVVIPPPLDPDRFRALPDSAREAHRAAHGGLPDSVILAHVSNHRPVKNLGAVIGLAREIQARIDRRCVLWCVGPQTSHLSDARAAAGPGLDIHVTGIRDDSERFHAAADLSLYASSHESFGLAIGESLLAGTPVIAPACAGVRSFAKDAVGAWWFEMPGGAIDAAREGLGARMVPADAAAALDSAVSWLRGARGRRQALAARDCLLEVCAPSRVADAWLALLEEIAV